MHNKNVVREKINSSSINHEPKNQRNLSLYGHKCYGGENKYSFSNHVA